MPCPQGLTRGRKRNTNLSATLVQMKGESAHAGAVKGRMLMTVKGKLPAEEDQRQLSGRQDKRGGSPADGTGRGWRGW